MCSLLCDARDLRFSCRERDRVEGDASDAFASSETCCVSVRDAQEVGLRERGGDDGAGGAFDREDFREGRELLGGVGDEPRVIHEGAAQLMRITSGLNGVGASGESVHGTRASLRSIEV